VLLRFMLTNRMVSFSDIKNMRVGWGIRVGARIKKEVIVKTYNFVTGSHTFGHHFNLFGPEIFVIRSVFHTDHSLDWFSDGSGVNGIDIGDRS
jgi:hypothetical protein